jgi:hypothetical protein
VLHDIDHVHEKKVTAVTVFTVVVVQAKDERMRD